MILPLDRMRANQFASVRTSEAEPHAAVKKLFGPNAGSTARHGETTEALARLCPMARRGIADPPLPALVQALDAISKRDPAATFNRYIHIDATPLTWSYAAAPELSRTLERSGS
jgi:hypothetical protein